MPLSPTLDCKSHKMDVNVIRFQPIPGLWSRCKNELKWSPGDAAAAIALKLNGMAKFMESMRDVLKEFIIEKDKDDFYEVEGSSTFWCPISQNLGCMVAAWGHMCPQGIKLAKERADKSYAELLEMWSQTHKHDLHVTVAQEKVERCTQNERLNLHNELQQVLQALEKRKSDHDVVASLADQLVEKTNKRVEKELSKVDLGLAGICATLKVLSGRINDITTRGVDAPTYAKATAASSAKGKEKETPAAEQKQGGAKDKEGPRDVKCPKDHTTPDMATTNILDLLSVANWQQLHAALTLGKMAPGIKLSDAMAITKGLQAPSAGSVTASLWSGVIPPPLTSSSTVILPDGKNKAVKMGAFGPAPPPFNKAKPKQKLPVHIKQGNTGVHPRQIVVRLLTKSFVVAGFTETMLFTACTNILTTEAGSANRPSSALLKKSEVDWRVTFIDRPNDVEFEALKKKLPEIIEAHCSITAAEILVEHMWTLIKMAIQNMPLSWKDPVLNKE
ncbi:hypothetical protein DAEQUDRAFT_769873 [Daedalea quercina L-15889]|uniref:Uncharacterized protein n=1 Tax=Daedalea quercina L-15889 TaxID=1314783 RepID=A0A165LD71_9APHY|nr:hypothetical protein DAEQUDRAFT_769873 [Daedalea quercina L-15889]